MQGLQTSVCIEVSNTISGLNEVADCRHKWKDQAAGKPAVFFVS
jgi:hypothetical protein